MGPPNSVGRLPSRVESRAEPRSTMRTTMGTSHDSHWAIHWLGWRYSSHHVAVKLSRVSFHKSSPFILEDQQVQQKWSAPLDPLNWQRNWCSKFTDRLVHLLFFFLCLLTDSRTWKNGRSCLVPDGRTPPGLLRPRRWNMVFFFEFFLFSKEKVPMKKSRRNSSRSR